MDIYVSNLSINVTEDELNSVFSRYGRVTHTVVLKDPVTNNPLGGAVVTMSQKTPANKAIGELNMTKIKERTVLVSPATSTGNRRARARHETDTE